MQLLLHLLDIGELHLFLGLLHKGEHIAHPEDAARHPLRVERLQGLHLLPCADELDRLTAHLADRQSGTTTGIAIKLGEHGSGDPHLVVKSPGEIGCFLTDHRIHHQQHLIRLHGGSDPNHLLHHVGVDLQTTGGVDQKRVETFFPGLGKTCRRNVFRFGVSTKTEHLDINLCTERLQLLNRGRSVHISTHHQRPSTLVLEVESELRCCRGLTSSLQTGHQHHRWSLLSLGKGGVVAAHHLHQLVVHHLNELLVWRDPAHHLGAHSLFPHLGDEIFNNRQTHIRLKQSAAHILERALHIGFADLILASQPFDGVFKAG